MHGIKIYQLMKTFTILLLLFIPVFSCFAKKHKVTIQTEYGNIKLVLYKNTPKNTENMVARIKEHFYDSLLFHRCIPHFVIQGGDPDSKYAKQGQLLGDGDLKFLVPAEINDVNFHKRGALGVARDNTPDKAGSACQFYIVVGKVYDDRGLDSVSKLTGHHFTPEQCNTYKTIGGDPKLDGNYTVFGEVKKGMDIVDKIANMERDKNDRPNKDIRIIRLY